MSSWRTTGEEVARSMAFGAICGSVTGFSMGLVDTYNIVRKQPPSGGVEGIVRLAFSEMARSGLIIATFFSTYQACKYAILSTRPGTDFYGLTAAATVSLLPLSLVAPLRRYVPFSLTLVGVDAYHTAYPSPKR